MKDVVVLTTSTCPHCKRAKEFLRQNKIYFIEKDVNTDPQARAEMARRHLTGVPSFIIGDDVVVGLDPAKILQLVDHRMVTCPHCSTAVRIPTKAGKIRAKCPKCGTELNEQ